MGDGKRLDRFEWFDAVFSELGPSLPHERNLLGVLYAYSSKKNPTTVWPSQDEIAVRAGISVSYVKKIVAKLKRESWIAVREGHGRGQSWRHSIYTFTMPDGVAEKLDESRRLRKEAGTRQSVPALDEGELLQSVPASTNESESSVTDVTIGDALVTKSNETPFFAEGGIRGARSWDNFDPKVGPSGVAMNPPSLNPPINPPQEKRPPESVRTPRALPETADDRTKRIQKLIGALPKDTDYEIAKIAKVSPEEVQSVRRTA